MKAFLINPPTGFFVREDRCQSSVEDFSVTIMRPPMDLMIMAASLESIGFECKISDYPMEKANWNNFEEDLKLFKPDILVISVTTPTLKEDMKACTIAKKLNPNIKTVAKGAHFSIFDKESILLFSDIDIVIRGENDIVVKEIAQTNDLSKVKGITYRKGNDVIRNQENTFIHNLDELPFPARHLINNNKYIRPDTNKPMTIIETSRGCPAGCIFCLAESVSGKIIRNRSPKLIVDEIEECVKKYNIKTFHFKSDTFTWNKKWLISLCQEIEKRNLKIKWNCNSRVDTLDEERIKYMKSTGCEAISFGVESGNQDILDKMKKKTTLDQARVAIKLCKKYKIKTYIYFLIGFPWDNEKTINDSINFSIELDGDFTDFFIAYPFPGTQLEKIVLENNLLIKGDEEGLDHAYAQPVLNTFYLSHNELGKLRKKALSKFYIRPKYILKMIFSVESPRVLINYFRHGIKTFLNIIKR